ncbi:MAG: ribosome hibernation-promoting factor, HPF/YfiA family [Lysobacteraceae bacterium]
MRIEISGHNIDVTPALRDYVNAKLERVDRHFDHHLDLRVILSVEKLEQKAEASIQMPGKALFADAVSGDMYASIDALADKLDRIVIKEKEKFTDHHRGTSPARSEDFG